MWSPRVDWRCVAGRSAIKLVKSLGHFRRGEAETAPHGDKPGQSDNRIFREHCRSFLFRAVAEHGADEDKAGFIVLYVPVHLSAFVLAVRDRDLNADHVHQAGIGNIFGVTDYSVIVSLRDGVIVVFLGFDWDSPQHSAPIALQGRFDGVQLFGRLFLRLLLLPLLRTACRAFLRGGVRLGGGGAVLGLARAVGFGRGAGDGGVVHGVPCFPGKKSRLRSVLKHLARWIVGLHASGKCP